MPDVVLRAVVVDDEPAARDAVITMLAREPHVELVAQATNGRDAVEVVRREHPDLLFLDVQMPDLDGFQVLEALGRDVPRGIVFVTAHDEHALRAFEVHALDYLLKPFGRPRFHAAVARAVERLLAHDALTQQRTQAAIATAKPPHDEYAGVLTPPAEANAQERPRRIGIRNGAKTLVLELDSVDWVEACGDYLRLHCGATSHLVAESMNNLERMLDPRRFLRVHRSIMVNLTRVREMQREPDGAGSLLMDNGVRLRVARGRWEALEGGLGLFKL